LFCQLVAARDLLWAEGIEGKLKHLGIGQAPNKSTLAYANEHRPWQVYQTVFEQLLGKCYSVAQGKKKSRFNNKLLSLDSTSIELCASIFDWAKYKAPKGR